MGPSFTLTRSRAEDGNNTNGLYIHESERDALYAGDLKLVNSGQGIDAYLTISMEDYLYGVVAYEMSDSFPLEALKAQAVAARTYAMRAKWNAGSREYDVVDTTADQVYKGYDPIYTRVIQAVNETRGIVGHGERHVRGLLLHRVQRRTGCFREADLGRQRRGIYRDEGRSVRP